MNRLSKPAFVAVLALGVWNVSSRTALAAPPRQFVDIQGDVMIWGGSSFALQCSDGQTDPETGILCYSYDHTHNATTTGLQQGWVWSVNLPRYTAARRLALYHLLESYGYTHVIVPVVPCVVGDPFYGSSYAAANTTALCTNGKAGTDAAAGSYGALLNNILDEIHGQGLITFCAGVAPGLPPAAGLDGSRCDLAMDDWDGTVGDPFQKDCRIDTLKLYFPNALLYVEQPITCDPAIDGCSGPHNPGTNDEVRPRVDSCTPPQFFADSDGFITDTTGDAWLAAVRQRDPMFAGVLTNGGTDGSDPSQQPATVRNLQTVNAWWRTGQQVRFEFDVYTKYHAGGAFSTFKGNDDFFLTNAPWLNGFMTGGTTHTPPVPTVTVSKVDAGSGTISSTPAGISCGVTCTATVTHGSALTLSTSPDPGSVFSGWLGNPACVPQSFIVNWDTSCVAALVTSLGRPTTYRSIELNGDGAGDAFLYNPTLGNWLMAYSDRAGRYGAISGQWGAGWNVYPADLNGDGLTDFFLYSPSTGEFAKVMNNGLSGFSYTYGQWSASWNVYPVDLNGDGRTDFLVYNPSSGQYVECVTDPSNPSGGFLYLSGQWSAGWQVVPARLRAHPRALQTDVFVYNTGTGAFARFVGADAATDSTVPTLTQYTGQWSAGWTVVPMRLNADAITDVFVYNQSTGAWVMCVSTADGTGFTYPANGQWSAGWTLTVGDFNGDGVDDLFLYNVSGGNWVEVQNTNYAFSYAAGQWSAGWDVRRTDLNGDGTDDLMVFSSASGAWVQLTKPTGGGLGQFIQTNGAPWPTGMTLVTTSTPEGEF